MELHLESVLLAAALSGTVAYTGYMIKKQRDEIRKTIQVVELSDTEFWQGLTELRDLIPGRA